MICERCGTVFCVDLESDGYWLARSRVRHCSKLCKRKSRPSHLGRHGNRKPRLIRNQVTALRRRDGDDCWLCGLPIDFSVTDLNDPMRYSRDHVTPRGLGGESTVANMRLAHRLCNTERDQKLAALQL